MYTFNQFKEEVRKHILDGMPDGYQDESVTVTIKDVIRGNDQKYSGLSIRREAGSVIPILSLAGYYENYLAMRTMGTAMGAVMEEIRKDYLKAAQDAESLEVVGTHRYEDIKPKLFVSVINYERSQEYLKDICYRKVPDTDFALVPRMLSNLEDFASAMVDNRMVAKWNVTEDEMFEQAIRNTPALLPAEVMTSIEVVNELRQNGAKQESQTVMLSGVEEERKEWHSLQPNMLYVLTNTQKTFGATAIFYPEILKEIAEATGSNIFIMPSSVNEVILMKDSGDLEIDGMQEMVMSINRTHVDPEEVLSDEVYCYDLREHKLVMATSREKTLSLINELTARGIEDIGSGGEQGYRHYGRGFEENQDWTNGHYAEPEDGYGEIEP